MSLGRKLKKLLETRNVAAVCRKADISTTHLASIIKGKSSPTIGVLKKIASTLEVSVGWLVDDAADFPPIYSNGKAAWPWN